MKCWLYIEFHQSEFLIQYRGVSHFAQKVRCEPSPPHIRAKRQIFVFNIESPVGFVPAGLFSWAGEGGGESCGKCWC